MGKQNIQAKEVYSSGVKTHFARVITWNKWRVIEEVAFSGDVLAVIYFVLSTTVSEDKLLTLLKEEVNVSGNRSSRPKVILTEVMLPETGVMTMSFGRHDHEFRAT